MKKTVSDDKHTPGPWYVDIDRAICAASLAKGMWRGVVAEVALPTHERGNQEREANAALIASAPTLKAENERLRGKYDELLARASRWMQAHHTYEMKDLHGEVALYETNQLLVAEGDLYETVLRLAGEERP